MMRQVEFAASVALPAGNRSRSTSSTTARAEDDDRLHGRPGTSAATATARATATWQPPVDLGDQSLTGQGLQPGRADRLFGGDPRRAARPAKLQTERGLLADLDQVYPGSKRAGRRDSRGRVQAHLENWSRLPLFQGVQHNQPGYFTTIEGLYARPAGNVYFAGEHTDSFYSYQGFMEGALLSVRVLLTRCCAVLVAPSVAADLA